MKTINEINEMTQRPVITREMLKNHKVREYLNAVGIYKFKITNVIDELNDKARVTFEGDLINDAGEVTNTKKTYRFSVYLNNLDIFTAQMTAIAEQNDKEIDYDNFNNLIGDIIKVSIDIKSVQREDGEVEEYTNYFFKVNK